MTDYWMMYAVLHSAVMEAVEALPCEEHCSRARHVLVRALEEVATVYARTHEVQEEA